MKIFKAVLSFCVLVFLLSSCSNQNDEADNSSSDEIYSSASEENNSSESEFDSNTLFAAIDSFDWVSEDNKPCLTSNMFANECKVFAADINNDNMPEILLTDVYSPREASYTEVFGLSGNELSSMGGFWGYVFNENEPTNIYENSSGETVFISCIESSHGGNTIKFTTEVNVSDLSQRTKGIEICNSEYPEKSKYYLCDSDIELNREFLDGEYSIQEYEEITDEEYDSFLSSYINSLSKQYETAAYNCGSLSVGNYPTGEMMASSDFDYQYYIEHKDESQSIDNANQTIADSIKQNILIWENTAVSCDVIIDNVKYLNDYNENEFKINSEKAMSDITDLLIEYEKWQEDFKLICSGMAEQDGEAFYQITLNTENDFSYSCIGTFWVNADNGTVYLMFDPTLDAHGYFSEFAENIPEDDYRTRLIQFYSNT